MAFGARLRRRREALGLSQSALGHQSEVSRWERGESQPNLDELRRLCTTLDVSSDFLLGLCPDEQRPPQGMWIRDLDRKEQNDAALAAGSAEAVHQGEFFAIPHRYQLLTAAEAAPLMQERNDHYLRVKARRLRRRRGHEATSGDLPQPGHPSS